MRDSSTFTSTDPGSEQLAAAHATVDVPRAAPGETADAVRSRVVGASFDHYDVAVLDGGALVGVVPLPRLLAADPAQAIGDLMDRAPPLVRPEADQEHAAWTMVQRGESSIAVVGADGRFAGLIPAQRMLRVLLAEHDEDVARLGGYLAGTQTARHAAEEPVGRRLWHRLPWLALGLLGAMVSALVVGAFEEDLERTALLAIFIPAVVYMADAVGTQTEAVLIRGLSVGIHMRAVARRELLTGLALGALVGGAFFPFAVLVWDDSDVALAVALALFASCSIATVVAMALPWAFQRLGRDPAFGSGPLATVIQDLLSILVYFAIAVPLAG